MSLLRRAIEAWLRFWFAVPDTRPLELVRIVTAGVLLVGYAMVAGHVAELYSDEGWLAMSHAGFLRERSSLSILYGHSDPLVVRAAWLACLGSSLALLLGVRTSLAKWVALVCHVSFMNRAPNVVYGVDHMTNWMLWLLCLAPVGQAYALDARRADRRPAWWRTADGPRRSAVLRLVQIQMVLVFFFAGTEKLRGDDWWDGDALWYALADQEFNGLPLRPFAQNMWLVNALSYVSILVEIGYAFLIWDSKTRPIALLGAIGLHVGIATMLSLILFALAMIGGHLAFTPSTWLDRLEAKMGRGPP